MICSPFVGFTPASPNDGLTLGVLLTVSDNPHPELIYHEDFLL